MSRAWSRIVPMLVSSFVVAAAGAAPLRTLSFKPSFLPPRELQVMLGAEETEGRSSIEWSDGGERHRVDVGRNDPSNLIVFTGSTDDVAAVEALARALDVAPRQIAIEARIVEVDTDKARELGVDWGKLAASANTAWRRNSVVSKSEYNHPELPGNSQRSENSNAATELGAFANLTDALRVLDQQGAATTRDAPSILTLNNRTATILDGSRVTYVQRASGYTNLYATDQMDAGLRLEVTPSLVESGDLRLQLRAELTTLLQVAANAYGTRDYMAISGSPVKSGQIVENTILARDGETVLLGGFTRTLEEKSVRRFPLLGNVLPWIFSRATSQTRHRETLIAITPHVVDHATAPGDDARRKLEGK